VDTAGAVAVRTQYFARPGRRAIVVTDLASLCGPVTGAVELPLRPFWSSPDRTFDLGDPFRQRWLHQRVLREASRPEDLTRDFADAGRQLDRIDDDAFAHYGLTRHDGATLRDRFATWPRTT